MESAQRLYDAFPGRRLQAPVDRVEPHVLGRDDARRAALERFIAQAYARCYGARVTHYADHLVGLERSGQGWIGAVGYTMAEAGPLFIEHYLDRPVEDEIAMRTGTAVCREQIAEAGNLAAPRSGASRRVIVYMTRRLHDLGRTWVVFTGTRSLLNSFQRLGIETAVLARAEPSRIPDAGATWGSYYATGPQVVAANIPAGFAHLRRAAAQGGAA